MSEDKYEKLWTLEEELGLLDAILECGFGNWTDICKLVPPYTAEECEDRYWDRFIQGPSLPQLADLSRTFLDFRRHSVRLCSQNCNMIGPIGGGINKINYSNIVEMESRIRHVDEKIYVRSTHSPSCLRKDKASGEVKAIEGSKSLKAGRAVYCQFTCPGYNPFRSEFEIDYDDKAERVLSLLQETPGEDEIFFDSQEDENLYTRLKVAIVQNYNFRLAERQRRKKIIRAHALLDRRKTLSMIQRYENVFRKKGGSILMKMLQVVRYGYEMDVLLERLAYQFEVKAKINKLLEYRREGLVRLSSVPLMDHLKTQRIQHRRTLNSPNMFHLCLDPSMRSPRRPAPPLTLHNLPGYNLLEDDEKELCSLARIVPETYHSFKTLLIQECKRHDGLKLIQARSLIKIDVNKTRKIYDFLMARNLIWTPPST